MSTYRYESQEKLIKEELQNSNNFKNNSEIVSVEKDERKQDLNKNLIRIELERDKSFLQWAKIKYLLVSYAGIIFLTLLRGSEHFKSIIGVETCSPTYWIVYFVFFPYCIVLTFLVRNQISKETHYRISIGFPYDKNDIIWSKSNLTKYPFYGFFAGIVAGLVGIGGGLIIGPILIEIGINPVISTITSNFLVLFTSSSTSIQFTLLGMMNLSYGGICTLFSGLGSFIGTVTVHYILLIFKRESFLIIVLAFVLVLSTILLPTYSIYDTLTKVGSGHNIWDFNSPC